MVNQKVSQGYVENKNPPPRPASPPPGQAQDPSQQRQRPEPTGQPSKDTYKVYPWRQSRRVVRIGGKLFGTDPGGRLKDGGNTKFNANDRARVRPDGGRMKVSKTDSDHTQTWDPVDEVRRIVDEIIVEMITRIGEA